MKRIYILIAASLFAASVMAQFTPDPGGVIDVSAEKPYVASELNLGWTGNQPAGFSAYSVALAGYTIGKTNWAYKSDLKSTQVELGQSVEIFALPAINISEDNLMRMKLKFSLTVSGIENFNDNLETDYEKSLYPAGTKVFKYFGFFAFNETKKTYRAIQNTVELLAFNSFLSAQKDIAASGDFTEGALWYPNKNGDYVCEWTASEALIKEYNGHQMNIMLVIYPNSKTTGKLAIKNVKLWDPDLGEEPADPTPTAIEQTKADGLNAYGSQGMITVNAQEGSKVSVANLVGQEVKSFKLTSRSHSIAIPAGIYVVSSNGKAKKVVVE